MSNKNVTISYTSSKKEIFVDSILSMKFDVTVNDENADLEAIYNDIEFISSDESVLKIDSSVYYGVKVKGVKFGSAELIARLKSDNTVFAKVLFAVKGSLEQPIVLDTVSDELTFTVTIDKNGADELIVDTSWESKPIDMTTTEDVLTFKIPNYDTSYVVYIAGRTNGVISEWVPVTLSKKASYDFIRDDVNIYVTRLSVNKMKVDFSISNNEIDKLKLYFNWNSKELEVKFNSLKDYELYEYSSGGFKVSGYLELEVPEQVSFFTVNLYKESGEYVSINNIRTCESSDYYSEPYMGWEGTPYIYVPNVDEEVNLYATPDSSSGVIGTLSPGQVFTSPDFLMSDDWFVYVGGMLPISGDASDPGNYYGFAKIKLLSGATCFADTSNLLGALLSVRNYPEMGTLTSDSYGYQTGMFSGTKINGNYATSWVLVNGQPQLMLGHKLIRGTTISNINGDTNTLLPAGAWVWTFGDYDLWETDLDGNLLQDYEDMYGNIIANFNRVKPYNFHIANKDLLAINSFSLTTDPYDIAENIYFVKEGANEGLQGYYFFDSGFASGNYSIDISRPSQSTSGGFGEYFPIDNPGDSVILWNGLDYSVRSTTENLLHAPDNIIGRLHQCYLISTDDGGIKPRVVANNCAWTANAMKGMDRHRVQNFLSIIGMLDNQMLTDGYCQGKRHVALSSPEYRHKQESPHICAGEEGFETIKEESSEIDSFFPFYEYIVRRLRKKCVEETGKPLDTLSPIRKSFDSNFAVSADPTVFYEINGVLDNSPLYGVRVMKDGIEPCRYDSYRELVTLFSIEDWGNFTLNEGDWIWFSEKFQPKFEPTNRNYISILGYSKGEDSEGNPNAPVIAPMYVDAGLSNTIYQEEDNFFERILKVITGKKDELPTHSARFYNIATMANKTGSEPIILFEDEIYSKKIDNVLCFNSSESLQVVDENGFKETISYGKLFTLLGEYEYSNKKVCRIFYYSEFNQMYSYGNIDTNAANLFKYDIRNQNELTQNIDGVDYGYLNLTSEYTNIYTKWGEYFCTAVENDFVLYNNKLNVTKAKAEFSLTIPKGIEKEDYSVFEENNKGTTNPIAPNWFAIEYYGYGKITGGLNNIKIDGYARLDFSKTYQVDFISEQPVYKKPPIYNGAIPMEQ